MEASVERMIHFLAVTQVPLSHQIVSVSHVGKLVCHGGILRLQATRIAGQKGKTKTHICRISACQQGSSGGGASRMDIVVVESSKDRK